MDPRSSDGNSYPPLSPHPHIAGILMLIPFGLICPDANFAVADRYFQRFESRNPPETSHPDEFTSCNNRKQLRSRNEYRRS